MEVFVLELAWGEYSDKDQTMLGVFSSEENAKQAKQDVIDKANRRQWPWSALDEDHVLAYYSVKMDELTFTLNREVR
jgi:hypothetical protein